LALAVAGVQVAGTFLAGHRQPEREDFDVLAALLLAAGPAGLVVRRRAPVAVLAWTFLTTAAYVALDYPRGPIFFGLIAAFFTAVLAGRRREAWASLALGYLSFLWLVDGRDPPSLLAAVGLLAWLIVLATTAEIVRNRREMARAREEEARRRTSEERLRIARELHDVLAHDISLINVQAGVALHLLEERPEQARTALTAIKAASKDALGELRSVLEVLRQNDEGAPRAPTVGLDHLDRLVSGAAAAGIDVRVVTEGTVRVLPAGIDLAAFRIVQEALTNVTRHAGPATATVSLDYGESELTVQVEDDGRGVATSNGSGAGSGIAGMRERVNALGGRLEAGPLPGRGFRVRASFPLGPRPGKA